MPAEIPLSQLSALVERAAAALTPADLAPVYAAMQVQATAMTKRHFADGKGPDGKAWAPLAFPRPSGGSGLPLRDTGRLMASIAARADAGGLVVGTAHPAASLHQHGGIVTAKKGKFLAIPLTKEARRAGSPRGYGKPLHFRSRSGGRSGALVESRTGKGKRQQGGRAVYALVPSVRVPARPFLGFGPDELQRLGALAGKWVASHIRAAGRQG